MPDIETMQRSRPELINTLNTLVDNASPDLIEEVKKHRQNILDNWDRGIELQAKAKGTTSIWASVFRMRWRLGRYAMEIRSISGLPAVSR
jgi:hypothetical protein